MLAVSMIYICPSYFKSNESMIAGNSRDKVANSVSDVNVNDGPRPLHPVGARASGAAGIMPSTYLQLLLLQLLLLNAQSQGLPLVHSSAQLKRLLCDRGAWRGGTGGVWEVSGGIKEHQGVFRVCFVSEAAQVELRSGRV